MFTIPEDFPMELAPLAWMLGTWRGWGMHSLPGDEPDQPILEEVRTEVAGTQLQMTTSLYRATPRGDELDPMLDAFEGIAQLQQGDLLAEETLYIRVMPGSGAIPEVGEVQTREFTASGATTSGIAVLWAGVSMGPRVRMISDAIARDAHAEPVEEISRMYGLVGGELMWTQERFLAGDEEPMVQFSGRLARAEEAPEDVSEIADEEGAGGAEQ